MYIYIDVLAIINAQETPQRRCLKLNKILIGMYYNNLIFKMYKCERV